MGKQIEGEENQKQIKQIKENKKQETVEQAYSLYFRFNLWLVENTMLQGMLTVWAKLDENKVDEYDGCSRILKIVQTMLELTDTAYPILVKDTQIIELLANRILPNFKVQHRIIDDNKFVASDVLLSLLQTPSIEQEIPEQQIYVPISAASLFHKHCGIQILVETISSYENNLPTQTDEREFLSNLFDCLNVLLVSIKDSRSQFHQMKGNYLMISYICIKTEFSLAALKAVSNTLIQTENQELSTNIANGIVIDGSLKYIFPIMMGQGLKGSQIDEQNQINEHVLSIIYALLKNTQNIHKDRVMYKFVEKRFHKLQRIFQLQHQHSQDLKSGQNQEITPQKYLKLIKEEKIGLVELCNKIILTLFQRGDKKMKDKIITLLPLFAIDVKNIRTVVERHYKFIDQGAERRYIEKLLAGSMRELLDISTIDK